jgi:DNA-binding response OmpR family regulator
VGNLILDRNSRTAAREGFDIRLTSSEFDLLWYLAARAGQVVSRDELYRQILKTEYDGQNRTIDLRVSRLRRKLNFSNDQRRLIKSIRFEGYCMAASTGSGDRRTEGQ